MQAGDKIRLDCGLDGMYKDLQDFTVEEFRFCLGIFKSEDHKKADRFTPLCKLYERGPESERDYISNFGEYTTNMVPSWMDLPRD